MKKYLLTLALSIVGFIGFSNAQSFSSVEEGFGICLYNPDTITISDNFDITSVSVGSCAGASCYFGLSDYSDCYVYGTNGNLQFGTDCPSEPGTYSLGSSDYCFSSITFGSSSAGGDSGSGTGDSLLPGGEGSLSGIITGLNSTITEFIPYLVYLGLGIITVIIGFVAIRWLVNRTQAKIRGTFSSGRRRK